MPHAYRSYAGLAPGRDGFPGPTSQRTTRTELYDRESDVAESVDVAGEHPEVVSRLLTLVEDARQRLGDRGVRGSERRDPGRY